MVTRRAWLVVGWWAGGLAAWAAEPTLADGWRALAEAKATEAREIFRQAQARPAEARAAKLGEAVALLTLQPKTTGNVTAARRRCEELIADRGDDEWAARAHYFLGRIAQLHTQPVDYAGAARHYTELAARWTGTELAQHALVSLALGQLLEPVPAEERARRYSALRSREGELTQPAARRDFHLALADACLEYDLGLEHALHHSLQAEAAGVVQGQRQASVLLRIAELARTLGQRERAREYYGRFLTQVRGVDVRLALVRERLAELGEARP